jgi:hypothetical protein
MTQSAVRAGSHGRGSAFTGIEEIIEIDPSEKSLTVCVV